jgi:adenylosuccinate synthase
MGLELTWDIVAQRSGVPIEELRQTEITSTTRRDRRVAEFGWDLLRRAATLNGPTDIAMTFTDYINARNKDARRFDQLTDHTIQLIEEIERVAGAPVSLIATRFHFRNIIDRRVW